MAMVLFLQSEVVSPFYFTQVPLRWLNKLPVWRFAAYHKIAQPRLPQLTAGTPALSGAQYQNFQYIRAQCLSVVRSIVAAWWVQDLEFEYHWFGFYFDGKSGPPLLFKLAVVAMMSRPREQLRKSLIAQTKLPLSMKHPWVHTFILTNDSFQQLQ